MAEIPMRKQVLDALVAITLRADKQDEPSNNLETFVRPFDFGVLSSVNTQIIYGRNGTGKTHLLRAFCRFCEMNYAKQRVLPVYMDMRDLALGPVLPSIAVDELILRFYRLFVRRIVEHLEDFAKKTITSSFFEKFFGSEAAERQASIQKSIKKLNAMLDQQIIEEKVNKYARTVTLGKEAASKLKAGFGVSASLSTTKPEVKAESEMGASAESAEALKESLEVVYGGLAVIDYAKIRTELENIVGQCDAKGVIILVDEWSSVDLKIQPLLAEMIRQTLGSSKKVSLKLAALKFFTRTSAHVDSGQPLGLQEGIDINPLADLDGLLNCDADPASVADFLTWIVYKHASINLPVLKKWSVQHFQDYLCSEIFENPLTYFELVRSSEGNPRDFLNVLSSCCASNLNLENKISKKAATQAAIRQFTDSKIPMIRDDESANKLLDNLFQMVMKNKCKLFLFSRRKAEVNPHILKLWHYRFVHLVCTEYPYFDQRGKVEVYSVFSMDYGKLLSMKIHKEGEKLVNLTMQLTDAMAGGPLSEFLIQRLPALLKSAGLEGKLHRLVGTLIFNELGTKSVDIGDSGWLVSNCVADNLL